MESPHTGQLNTLCVSLVGVGAAAETSGEPVDAFARVSSRANRVVQVTGRRTERFVTRDRARAGANRHADAAMAACVRVKRVWAPAEKTL